MCLHRLLITLIQTQIYLLLQQIWVTDQFRMKLFDSFDLLTAPFEKIDKGDITNAIVFTYIQVHKLGLFTFIKVIIRDCKRHSKWNLFEQSRWASHWSSHLYSASLYESSWIIRFIKAKFMALKEHVEDELWYMSNDVLVYHNWVFVRQPDQHSWCSSWTLGSCIGNISSTAPFAKVVTFKGWLQTPALLTQRLSVH